MCSGARKNYLAAKGPTWALVGAANTVHTRRILTLSVESFAAGDGISAAATAAAAGGVVSRPAADDASATRRLSRSTLTPRLCRLAERRHPRSRRPPRR